MNEAQIYTALQATERFGPVGSRWAIGEQIRNYRWARPVTTNNPRPDLDSCDFPPTFVDAGEIHAAFGLDARRYDIGEYRQPELFDTANYK